MFRSLRHCVGGLLILLFVAGSLSAADKSNSRPFLMSMSGSRYQSLKQFRFPLAIETSSLAYDDSDKSFYTTADKGPIHLVKFRIDHDSIRIVHSAAISGLARNYDLEGITIAGQKNHRYLLISTERWRRKDYVVIFGADFAKWSYLPDRTFAVTTPGIGVNNNFEGVTYDAAKGTVYFVKEHTPYGLFCRPDSSGLVMPIFSETDFQPVYNAFIDSAFGPPLDTAQLRLLRPIALSEVTFDADTRTLLVLNRFGRAIIQLGIEPGEKPGWKILAVWPYFGIDDNLVSGLDPNSYLFGQAEGLALVGHGSDRKLALICDPGTGNRSNLTLFPWPTK